MTTIPRRRLLATAAALAALALAPNLGAARPSLGVGEPLVRVEVIDRDSGGALKVWSDHGRPVVAGRPGARYAVRLVNDSALRVLAVLAIDGVNAITGETAAGDQRGYVLEPWQSADITGWRKSDEQVAAFEFTALPDSYAARTGRPRDVGVIGVAVFREAAPLAVVDEPPPRRVLPPPPFGALPAPAPEARAALGATAPADKAAADVDPRRRAEAAAGARAPAPEERLGTGHGARETSVARTTTFERASSAPAQQVAIRYDSLANLVAAGIVPPPRVARDLPRPFPADPAPGYVPDPPSR